MAELLDVSTELIYENMVTMAFEGDIQIDSLDGQTVVYLYLYYLAEQKVCKNIAAIAGAGLKALSVDIDSMIKMTEGETGSILSEQQITAVKSSLTSGVSVITGGPGTGKTTIINTIINIFLSKVSSRSPLPLLRTGSKTNYRNQRTLRLHSTSSFWNIIIVRVRT